MRVFFWGCFQEVYKVCGVSERRVCLGPAVFLFSMCLGHLNTLSVAGVWACACVCAFTCVGVAGICMGLYVFPCAHAPCLWVSP